MGSFSKEQIAGLLELQKIDTEKIRIQSTLDAVYQKIETLDKKMADCERRYKENKSSYDTLMATYRSHEMNLKMIHEQIENSEKKLREIKTNREYQTLLREIDDNKKKISVVEEEMLQMMEQIELEERSVAQIQQQMKQLEQQTATEKEEIFDSTAEDKKALEKIKTKRRKLAEKIDPALLDKYCKILKQCGGVAIVPVDNSICGGCHINIPPQEFIEVQRGKTLRFCPHCHRIMCWESTD